MCAVLEANSMPWTTNTAVIATWGQRLTGGAARCGVLNVLFMRVSMRGMDVAPGTDRRRVIRARPLPGQTLCDQMITCNDQYGRNGSFRQCAAADASASTSLPS